MYSEPINDDEFIEHIRGNTINDGNYHIAEYIGQGGMGVVFLAQQRKLNRKVAIKFVLRNVMQLHDEAMTLASLKHPHILTVHDILTEEYRQQKVPYIVMDYAEGGSLATKVDAHDLSLDELMPIVVQICDALNYMHNKEPESILHLDLKPENILFDENGDVKLADFGIAKILGNATSVKGDTFVGTPGFMPPEQIFGRNVGPYSDIYALGRTIHVALNPSIINNDNNDAGHSYGKEIPARLQAVLRKATSDNREDRYQSAVEFKHAYEASFEDQWKPENTPQAPVTFMPAKSQYRLMVLIGLVIIVSGVIYLRYNSLGSTYCGEYNSSGLEQLRTADYDASILDLEKAIEIYPGCASAYYNLGVAYEENNRFVEARIAYETTLEKDDQLLSAHYRLGEILLDDGKIDEGLQIIDTGVRMLQLSNLNIDSTGHEILTFQLYTARGRAYYLLHDYSQAERDLKHAVLYRDAVDYPAEVHYYLALVYEAIEDNDLAYIEWLDTIGYSNPLSERHRSWVVEAQEAISENE